MFISPYLERREIVAVPRVPWGREDSVILRLRALLRRVEGGAASSEVREVAREVAGVAREIAELVFRETRSSTRPCGCRSAWGEWAAIAEEAEKVGWLVRVGSQWEPLPPHQVDPRISVEAVEKLPLEFREVAMLGLEPDEYRLRRKDDLDFGTGFLSPEEVGGIFRALPIEVTFADANDRVRFYSEGRLPSAFAGTRTILGRRLLFCHQPRLERLVEETVEALKRGEADHGVYWTRIGDRIVGVFISAVRGEGGRCLGAVEVVEDFTKAPKETEEVLKRVVVL